MKKTLNSRMEEAGIRELMPGFDKEAMWQQINSRMQHKKRVVLWPRLAAACLLVVLCAVPVWLLTKSADKKTIADGIAIKHEFWHMGVLPEWSNNTISVVHAGDKDKVMITPGNKQQNTVHDSSLLLASLHRSGEFVCNSTPCPLEICITQIMKCADGTASAITSCSTVDPDQARQMRFNNNKGSDCSVTIDEIRIKRVNTGETIVLTGDSEPSTARELFDCLTGNADCNLLAGVFNNNCDNEHGPLELKIEKEGGSLILE